VGSFLGLISSLASAIRWGEPLDTDFDDDPLLSPDDY